jgi:LPXTG-motif cell wall-anchored protein
MYLSDAPDWVSALLPSLTKAYADRKLINAQAERIRAGQQPVALPPVGPTLTPLPAPQFDPATLQLPGVLPAVPAGALGLPPQAWMVAAGLAAAGLGLLLLGRRRR